MPVYDYKCQTHGLFYELASVADSDKPAACPTCGKSCPRVIILAPELFKMDKDVKEAHELNERNQHEPTFSTTERREDDEQHASGCGCSKKLSRSKLMYTAQGDKMFPSMRPWMISH